MIQNLIKLKIKFVIILFFIAPFLRAQDIYEASLAPVNSSGYYIFKAPLELYQFSKVDFSDVRIVDSNKHQVPYLLTDLGSEKIMFNAITLPLIKKNVVPNGKSFYVFKNENGFLINKLYLTTNTSNVAKSFWVEGSYDGNEYFAITSKSFLVAIGNQNKGKTETMFELPTTTYSFVKLWMNDEKYAPLEIIKLEKHNESVLNFDNTFSINADSIRLLSQANKSSFYKISFKDSIIINSLKLNINTTNELYNRNASLALDFDPAQPHKFNATFSRLISNKENVIAFDRNVKLKCIYLKIDNEDNPALPILSATGIGVYKQIACYLQANNSYTIQTGNYTLQAPVYDVSTYKDSVLKIAHSIDFRNLEFVKINTETAGFTFFKSKKLVWIILIFVLAILGFFALKMIKDMNVNK